MTVDVPAWLASISAAHWSIVVAIGFIIGLWVWFNRESADNTFRFVDAFVDEGKASTSKCLLWMFAVIAAWQVMLGTFRGQDMTTLTLGVIGILVTGKTLTQGANALANRPQPAPPAVNATNSDVTVTPAATPPVSGATIALAKSPGNLPPAIRIGG